MVGVATSLIAYSTIIDPSRRPSLFFCPDSLVCVNVAVLGSYFAGQWFQSDLFVKLLILSSNLGLSSLSTKFDLMNVWNIVFWISQDYVNVAVS